MHKNDCRNNRSQNQPAFPFQRKELVPLPQRQKSLFRVGKGSASELLRCKGGARGQYLEKEFIPARVATQRLHCTRLVGALISLESMGGRYLKGVLKSR